MGKLGRAMQAVRSQLSSFAASASYWSLMEEIFGVGPERAAAHAIESQLRNGDLGQLARVEVISASLLGPARAAYAAANGTIYISDRFLAEATQPQLQAALLEEFGHVIDARVNQIDRPGDEGELFSLRVRGITPTSTERQRIMAEDDHRTLTIKGVNVRVEQAAPVVYETSTVPTGFNRGEFRFGSNIVISGANAAWVEQKGSNRLLRLFNGSSTSTIANSVYQDFGEAALSGANLAYTKSDGQDLEVYRYSAGTTTRLTTNTTEDRNVLIDGNLIAWQSYAANSGIGEIYAYNIATATQNRITTNTVEEEDVQLSGNNILWAASDGNDYEIYLFNGATTQQLTNNSLDDYNPVLSGNRAAWFQWNNNQENLFFYNGSTTQQVTTNLDVAVALIAGNNLVYQQREANGDISLKLFNSSTLVTRTLSSKIFGSNVQVSGNFVAWAENNTSDDLATLKLDDGTATRTVASNASVDYESFSFNFDSSFSLRGNKLVYVGEPLISPRSYDSGEIFLVDVSTPASVPIQVTENEDLSPYDLEDVGVDNERILWRTYYDAIKLSQPTTKPTITFATTTLNVIEGFTSPQVATLTVKLSAASSAFTTLDYEIFTNFNDDNPASFSDYSGPNPGSITFAPGVVSQTINIPIVNDDFNEPDEKFYVRLSQNSNNPPSGAVIVPGGQNIATVVISDTWQTTGVGGTFFNMPEGVENLTLTGTANIHGTGNDGDNIIRGNSGRNILNGGNGGVDQLIGGLHNDYYRVNNGNFFQDVQIIENPNEGTDTVQFSSQFESDEYILDNNVENLTLLGTNDLGGFGNSLDNLITGNSGSNFLRGAGGIDTVSYAGAPRPGVVVNLNTGTASGWGFDRLEGFENIIGSAFADTLIGDNANNTLTGNAGKDLLTGNLGTDKFDYRTLSHSLLADFDRITDFTASLADDRFLVSTARAGFISGGQVTTLITDAALTAAAISTRLTNANFLANFAATVKMGSGATSRTFVVINDAVAGFDAARDAVVEVTGFTGGFNTSQFVIR